jgi:hypothetical protein
MWDPEIKWTLWLVIIAAAAAAVATLIYSAIAK